MSLARGAESVPETVVATPPGTVARKEIRLTAEIPSLEFGLTPKGDEKRIQFRPNDQLNWGLSTNWRGYEIGASIPQAQDDESIKQKGKTDHRDYRLGYYGRQLGADVHYQSYRGFYIDDQYDGSSTNGKSYVQRPDLNSQNYGANFYFALTPERFPLRRWSIHRLDGELSEPGGSLVGMISYNDFYLNARDPLTAASRLRGLRLQTASVAAGYGYQYSREGIRANAILLGGLGPQWQNVHNGETKKRVQLATHVGLLGTLAYEWSDWITGVTVQLNTLDAKLPSGDRLTTSEMSAKLFASLLL